MIAALATVLLLAAPPTLVEPPPLAEASAPAVRLEPPQPPPVESTTPPPPGSSASANGRCVGWEPLLAEHSPGWSIERMSRIIHRESRCIPTAKNPHSSATGLTQILTSNCPYISRQLGEPCSGAKLKDPAFNIRAAAVLWLYDGYGPWAVG